MKILLWLLLAALVGASAFFSAAEAALTALSPLRMKRLSIAWPQLAPAFQEWLNYPQRFLTFLLVGNNLVNVSISSLAAVLALPLANHMPPWFFDLGLLIIVTALILVFAEITPKIVARAYREKVSVQVLPILRKVVHAANFFLTPLLWILDRAGLGRLTGKGDWASVSVEELHHIIGESEAAGHMPPHTLEMMRRVLELPQRAAAQIMVPTAQVDAVPLEVLEKPERGLDYFIDRMVEMGHSRVPVTFAGEFLGYLRPIDFLTRGPIIAIQQLRPLIQNALTVSPGRSAQELLEEFQRTGVPMAFVREDKGPVQGIVTLEDVLEEIVGEILDEYDLEMQDA